MLIDLKSLEYNELHTLREDLEKEFKIRKYEQKRETAIREFISISKKLFDDFPEVHLEIEGLDVSRYFPLEEGDFYV